MIGFALGLVVGIFWGGVAGVLLLAWVQTYGGRDQEAGG